MGGGNQPTCFSEGCQRGNMCSLPNLGGVGEDQKTFSVFSETMQPIQPKHVLELVLCMLNTLGPWHPCLSEGVEPVQ